MFGPLLQPPIVFPCSCRAFPLNQLADAEVQGIYDAVGEKCKSVRDAMRGKGPRGRRIEGG